MLRNIYELPIIANECIWNSSFDCVIIYVGRNYNISVQTVSYGEISLPTTAQYRTVPLRPRNVTFDRRLVSPYSFHVHWEEPKGIR